MNSIQVRSRIDFYLDVSRNARFGQQDYNKAVNDAIQVFMNQRIGDENQRAPENFQWIQQIRDEMYTLLKEATSTPSNGTVVTNRYYSSIPSAITFPTDYYNFVSLRVVIDGYSDYARPTTYNEIGPLLKDSFKHPTNQKVYYNENTTGLTIWRGSSGTFSSAILEYIKTPLDFNVGADTDLINAGAGVLTNGSVYIATEVSVQNSVTYQIGDAFTASGTTLTSGQVILASKTQTIELPEKTHSDIAKMAAAIMLKVTANYPAAQAVGDESNRD